MSKRVALARQLIKLPALLSPFSLLFPLNFQLSTLNFLPSLARF